MQAIMEQPTTKKTPAEARVKVSVKPITTQVMDILGRVPHMIKSTSTPVGRYNHRVNIWTGKNGDKFDPIIAQSFFVTVDEQGVIVNSLPEIR